MQQWKKNEYQVAKMFGGKRRRQQKWYKQGPDTFNESAEIEVKTRNEIPTWLTNPLKKTALFAGSRKTPICIWIEMEQDPEDGIAVLYARDLKALLDRVKGVPLSNSEQPSPTHATPSQ